VEAMSTAASAGVLAHGVHYALVLLGLWGLAALLVPHALERFRAAGPPAYDEHERRVLALREAVAAGRPGIAAPVLATPVPDGATGRRAPAGTLSVPLAIVASAAAAGIHAAVAPPHLREQAVAGLFFLLAAGAQLAWSAAALRPSAGVLRAGIALQLALVAVWLVTRTTALPFGLLPERHPVGAWDLTCVVAELASAAACWEALRAGAPGRCPSWFDWHPVARGAVGATAVALVLLTLSGAHS
jgi:hypothetical protein